MFEQSFSAKNLRKVYDRENKKGNYLEGRFFPEIEILSKKVKSARQSLYRLRKKKEKYTKEIYDSRKTSIINILRGRKRLRDEEINKHLDLVSQKIANKHFKIGIRIGAHHNGKPTYRIYDSTEAYFAEKQLQQNIKNSFKVKPSDRNTVIPQIISLLENSFPKVILRTDIKNFYESIEHKSLYDEIFKDNKLSLSSFKKIKDILNNFSETSGNTKGLPRGIGISAYLSEIYLASLDE
ncbi:hypothetical protein [Halotalea alkalilenta]|uniref:hypothetical protein n=1 Tax=Halotalea alkalilenta TaxID=376489 RepID=UPI0012DD6321|nr:hypothetical protein [Halotalea alkalilenta]